VSVAPILGANWQDKKGVDYYYGVNNSEVTATRKAYKGKAAITPFVGLELEAKLSKHFSLIGGAKYKHLPTAITESPLTKDKKGDYHVNVGLTYWF
jgi:outer membrane protein